MILVGRDKYNHTAQETVGGSLLSSYLFSVIINYLFIQLYYFASFFKLSFYLCYVFLLLELGHIANNDTADVAVDQYHHYKVKL